MIAPSPLGDVVDGVCERIEYDYNRQGQVIEMKDPNETVHQYQFDGLGRTTEDAITAFGTGIDQAVKRIEITYDSRRSLRTKVTQYDAATGGSIVNEVEFAYNDFRQLSDDKQEHDGAVDGNTLKVSYGYEDGDEANSIRRTSMTYPNGRVLDYQYGTADGANDSLSRVESLQVNGETPKLCTYTFVGAARYVKIAYPEPNIELTYFKESGVPDGDAGDKYAGYDRFGRTVDMRWIASTGGAAKDRIQYGYDRAGNRTWRKNLAATDGGQDNSYQYDGLYQVRQAAKGNLNLNQTAISAIPAEDECFTYDPTGNWTGYRREEDGAEELDQSRVNNQDNQITQIDGTGEGIAHDRAGNTTKMPPDAGGDWSKHLQLTWDGWNRLVEVRDENGETVATYEYDGLYRRMTKTESRETRHYYYSDQWKSLEERVDSSNASSSSSSAGGEESERQYLWGVRTGHRDELIRRDRSEAGNLDEHVYCLMDYFSPTSVVNASGAVQERYAFSAFGSRTIMDAQWNERSSSTFDLNFAFHGQFIDSETGYYDYGFRYYSASIGRWLSSDPIGEIGGLNLYSFTENGPTDSTDFLGLNSTTDGAALLFFDKKPPQHYPGNHATLTPKQLRRYSRTFRRLGIVSSIFGYAELYNEYLNETVDSHYESIGMPTPSTYAYGEENVERAISRGVIKGGSKEDLLEYNRMRQEDFVSTKGIPLPDQTWKDQKTGCCFIWSNWQAGGWKAHDNYAAQVFGRRKEVYVRTPAGGQIGYDGGWIYPSPVGTVGEVKTGREWSLADPTRWSPIQHAIYQKDKWQFGLQARVASICKLRYRIYLKAKRARRAFADLHPAYRGYIVP